MKFVHAADLHLDSPLRGLSRYEGAPVGELRLATRGALRNLVDLAVDESVDAVLLAGDIFDGDWLDYQTGLFFAKQMSTLREVDIPVYLVSGNHDAQSAIIKRLQLPDNAHTLDTSAPQTVEDECGGLAVHGQGFPQRDVKDNLALGYPAPRGGLFNIGLLHTALTGHDGHEPYAPCKASELAAKGYDYWALGHVHTREVVSRDPWIVFPGNIQGRNARETGPKGCTLVTVDDLRVVSVEHRNLDVLRWEHLRVDASNASDADGVVDLVASGLRELSDGLLRAVRISVEGRTAAHLALCRDRECLVNQIRLLANDVGGVWVEKVRIGTRPPHHGDDGDGGNDGAGLIADLSRTADQFRLDGDRLRALITGSHLYAHLPAEATGAQGIDPQDADWLRRLGDEAVDLLAAMIARSQENR